ncbi:HIRAN domain-containing protein [Aquihabitans daechungensis]|uniref:HIRAN domain-containing protein n=1 Tax=Aquihabitans daechungensis TaxID=1052257 RepID=UPI003BA287EA
MALFKRRANASDGVDPGMGRTGITPGWMSGTLTGTLCEGEVGLEVVGESYYQDALWRLSSVPRGSRVSVDIVAILVAEIDNPYDPNAIAVWINGLKVGHLSSHNAARYRPGLLNKLSETGGPIFLSGTISGGGARDDGPGMLGVFLQHDPTDFGLPAPAPPKPSLALRTGRHLVEGAPGQTRSAWRDTIPDDDGRAIKQLRAYLTSCTDPLDRHYTFCELEHRLYRCRDVFDSALTEFDQACQAHDAEMDTIAPGLVRILGGVPFLETYRQACIRHQKAKDWPAAIRWAERGLTLYGTSALRSEDPDDLRQRLTKLQSKVNS